MLAEGECLLVDCRECALVEHLEEAKDAEIGECAVPPSICRLGGAGDAGRVDHVYREGGDKSEKGPPEDDKEDDPERSLGELLVGGEHSARVVVWLCIPCSGVARILDGIGGRVRGYKGDRRVEEGEEAVGERTWAEWRGGEPLAESIEGADAWSNYGEGRLGEMGKRSRVSAERVGRALSWERT